MHMTTFNLAETIGLDLAAPRKIKSTWSYQKKKTDMIWRSITWMMINADIIHSENTELDL